MNSTGLGNAFSMIHLGLVQFLANIGWREWIAPIHAPSFHASLVYPELEDPSLEV